MEIPKMHNKWRNLQVHGAIHGRQSAQFPGPGKKTTKQREAESLSNVAIILHVN